MVIPRLLLLLPLSAVIQDAPPPRTVESVNLKAYAGTYYEAARFPNKFQKQCVSDVTATYVLRRDQFVDVINRCRTAGGKMEEARGVAKRAGRDTSNARLKVRFAPSWLSLIPKVWGDYWILAVGPAYGYVVVGEPKREYLWILSRVPTMPAAAYQQALEIVKSNGYDVSRLVRTAQSEPK